jgi:hypothetical protein
VLAYKFLGSGRVGLFSGFAWPVDEWVEVAGPLVPSSRGIHACRVGDLPHWLDQELWIAELEDPILEERRMVVAARGRLVERIVAWDERAAAEFTADCVARGRAYPGWGEDAAEWADHPDGQVSAVYIVAHAAGLASLEAGRSYDEGFLEERRWQADWLARRLELHLAPR